MKIKLSTLIDEFDMRPDLSESYLDKETGEILFISEDDRFALEHEDREPPEWQKEHLESIKPLLEDFDPERYIGLPSSFDFHEYSVMEKFIASLSSIKVQDSLWSAIKGSGAFRRFKAGIDRFGIADQWYSYRDAAIKQFIIDWCETENIPYVDDTAG
jgi:hypothetical protein